MVAQIILSGGVVLLSSSAGCSVGLAFSYTASLFPHCPTSLLAHYLALPCCWLIAWHCCCECRLTAMTGAGTGLCWRVHCEWLWRHIYSVSTYSTHHFTLDSSVQFIPFTLYLHSISMRSTQISIYPLLCISEVWNSLAHSTLPYLQIYNNSQRESQFRLKQLTLIFQLKLALMLSQLSHFESNPLCLLLN